jgi:site-specific DNA-adenine methylase
MEEKIELKAFTPGFFGGKTRLAKKIVTLLHNLNPTKKIFVDIMGGGGSVTIAALKSGYFDKVIYNEIDNSLFRFVESVVDGTFTIPIEYFETVRYNAEYWKNELERIMNLNPKERQPHEEFFVQIFSFSGMRCKWLGDTSPENIKKRYDKLIKHYMKIKASIFDKNIIKLYNESYENVPIEWDNTIVYCDPPYYQKQRYYENNWEESQYDDFYNWVLQNREHIYISEYENIKAENANLNVLWMKDTKTSATYNSTDRNRTEVIYH